MSDLYLFLACFCGALPLLLFGLAYLATLEAFNAEAEQFPLPSNDPEPCHVARPVTG